MYLTYTICSEYHNTTEEAYCVPHLHNMLQLSYYYRGSILCTLPMQYAPNIIILPREHIVYLTYTISRIIIIPPRKHIVYLTYTICSEYHNTTEVAYCVPYLHNMHTLPKCYQGSILSTLHTQYAPIIISLPNYHTTKVAFCVPYLHNMLQR